MYAMEAEFRHFDTAKPDGAYVRFERVEIPDSYATPVDYECYEPEQLEAWRRGEWAFIGIAAKANVVIVRRGIATTYEFLSPGVFGVEDNSSPEFLNELFTDQVGELKADLAMFAGLTDV